MTETTWTWTAPLSNALTREQILRLEAAKLAIADGEYSDALGFFAAAVPMADWLERGYAAGGDVDLTMDGGVIQLLHRGRVLTVLDGDKADTLLARLAHVIAVRDAATEATP